MTVALNNSQGNTRVTGTSINVSYASGSGTNRLLLVQTKAWSGDNVTGLTYNGAALSLVNNFSGLRMYQKVAPATGTNTLNITTSVYDSVAYEASDWVNVNQITPVGSAVTGSGTSNTPATGSITCPSGGAIFGGEFSAYSGSGSVTAGSGTTLTHGARDASAGYTVAGGYRATTGTISFNIPSSVAWTAQGVPINPDTVATSDISGTATLDDVSASGTLSVGSSIVSGTATLDDITASGTVSSSPASGTITSPVLKNNTGTVLASVTGIVANVYNATTGALVVRKTGLSSNGSGIVTITDVLLTAGVTYAYELDLSATSQGRRLPTGVAA